VGVCVLLSSVVELLELLRTALDREDAGICAGSKAAGLQIESDSLRSYVSVDAKYALIWLDFLG
jgi:hypothetical protein